MTTTLYLVSAETPEGEGYWKVGITKHVNPLKRNPKAYREVFHSQVFESEGAAKDVEMAIARTFKAVAPCAHGREALEYKAGLEIASEIYDFCLNEYFQWKKTDRRRLYGLIRRKPELRSTAIFLFNKWAVGCFVQRKRNNFENPFFENRFRDSFPERCDRIGEGAGEWIQWGEYNGCGTKITLDMAIDDLINYEGPFQEGYREKGVEMNACKAVSVNRLSLSANDRYSAVLASWKKSVIELSNVQTEKEHAPMW